jgi:mannitol-1-phosphate 5-dehydrogenase
MSKSAIIFGAGKTGRGFAAHLCANSDYEFTLVDKDQLVIENLNRSGKFMVEVLGMHEKSAELVPKASFQIKEDTWIRTFTEVEVCFTAVFGNNFKELAIEIAKGLEARYKSNKAEFFNIVTCENLSYAATVLKKEVIGNLKDKVVVDWVNEKVGFVESMILKTCLEAGKDQDPLTVRAQNIFELPCDKDAFKGKIPDITGLSPISNFVNQLVRKIYTYNCINAVITYLGAQKGYTELFEAGNDPEILHFAVKAGNEASNALIAEFGFDRAEQDEWQKSAFQKFADTNIPDPLLRNGADPIRKLAKEDRLVGPANLALKHKIVPEGIIEGIIAGFDFKEKGESINDMIKERGLETVLDDVCGVQKGEPLFEMIHKAYLAKGN